MSYLKTMILKKSYNKVKRNFNSRFCGIQNQYPATLLQVGQAIMIIKPQL